MITTRKDRRAVRRAVTKFVRDCVDANALRVLAGRGAASADEADDEPDDEPDGEAK